MSDSGSAKNGKPGLPSWQLKTEKSSEADAEEATPETKSEIESKAHVIEQAKKFLLEDDVREASTEKKITFLESKGLEESEIQELLGVRRNADASNHEIEATQNTQRPILSPPEPPARSPTRDAPPIITYPEFLTTPTEPAPLITARRLLTTLYLFGSLSFLFYGTSKYLIAPMVTSLTDSRHSLAETTNTNLDKLVARLGGVVSETPENPGKPTVEDDFEEEESDEDPTEMFHRDIGVQTSLPASPSASRPGSPSLEDKTTSLDEQTSRLSVLKSHTLELLEDSGSEGHDFDELSTTITDLRTYLDKLAYVVPTYGYGGGITMYGVNKKDEQDDEISKVKAEIRGVKGVLLSARSFPGGTSRAR